MYGALFELLRAVFDARRVKYDLVDSRACRKLAARALAVAAAAEAAIRDARLLGALQVALEHLRELLVLEERPAVHGNLQSHEGRRTMWSMSGTTLSRLICTNIAMIAEYTMFCEDAARRVKHTLAEMDAVKSYWLKVEHQESLHAHNAVVIDQLR